jgi:hypothetical protein
MLCVTALGAYLGFIRSEQGKMMVGVLSFYLVTTAWLTATRKEGKTEIVDWGVLVLALAITTSFAIYGFKAAHHQPGIEGGVEDYFIFGGLALFSAALDIRMLARGGVFGAHRIARHVWRMCVPLLFAANSLFLGQSQVFPEFIRKSNILWIPSVLTLVLMIFWLCRVWFSKIYKSAVRVTNQ